MTARLPIPDEVHTCELCGKQFPFRRIGNNIGRYCSRPCSHRAMSILRKGVPAPHRKDAVPGPTRTPTEFELGWAIGLWEGEGSAGGGNRTVQVSMSQKDDWVLERMVELFGGRIYRSSSLSIPRWQVAGELARSFVLQAYPHVSPRRQVQLRKAMTHWASLLPPPS